MSWKNIPFEQIFTIVGLLVSDIVKQIGEGATDEEIRARLADPAGVGQKLIEGVRSRASKFDTFVKNG